MDLLDLQDKHVQQRVHSTKCVESTGQACDRLPIARWLDETIWDEPFHGQAGRSERFNHWKDESTTPVNVNHGQNDGEDPKARLGHVRSK
jgi:hypothetical protein